jgi:hypothetical protein
MNPKKDSVREEMMESMTIRPMLAGELQAACNVIIHPKKDSK